MTMSKLLDDYRYSCNLITERINLLTALLHEPLSYSEYRCLNARVNVLRAERMELMDIMRSLRRYSHEQ